MTYSSKIAASIRNAASSIKNSVIVTVSERSPESIRISQRLPRTGGWRLITDIPIKRNGRKDYIKFIKATKEKEVWIKLSTNGGRSKVYVR